MSRPQRKRSALVIGLLVALGALVLLLGRGKSVSGNGPELEISAVSTVAKFPVPEARQRAKGFIPLVLRDDKGGKAVDRIARVQKHLPLIKQECEKTGFSPDLLAGIILIESGGKLLDVSGASCAGICQFSAGTGRNVGLRIAKPSLTRNLLKEARKGNVASFRKLQRLDERYDPKKAIPAAAAHLADLQRKLGGDAGLAVASYHMGEGNLGKVLRAFKGTKGSAASIARSSGISWDQLMAEVTPRGHPNTYATLIGLEDDSATYVDRVRAASLILAAAENDTAELNRMIVTANPRQPRRLWRIAAEPTIIPTSSLWKDWRDLEAAASRGELQDGDALAERHGFVLVSDAGSLSSRPLRRLYRLLRPEVAQALGEIREQVSWESKGNFTPEVTGGIRTKAYQRLVSPHNRHSYSAHAAGWSVDLRLVNDPKRRLALEFVLEQRRKLGLLMWIHEGDHYHVTFIPSPSWVAEFLFLRPFPRSSPCPHTT